MARVYSHRGDRGHRGLLPHAEEMYSLPLGWTQPLDALEPYMDCAFPRLDPTDGTVIVAAPFLCPADGEIGPRHGFSYAYLPTAFMQLVPNNPQVTVTQMYEETPTRPIL